MLDMARFSLSMFTESAQSEWNFNGHKRYEMSMEEGILRFFFEDGTIVECPAQAIGSFSKLDNTWAWAWANESISEELKSIANQCLTYGQEKNIEVLTTASWPADMEWAWSLTAFAATSSQARGAFCAVSGPLSMFLTFYDVKIIKPGATA